MFAATATMTPIADAQSIPGLPLSEGVGVLQSTGSQLAGETSTLYGTSQTHQIFASKITSEVTQDVQDFNIACGHFTRLVGASAHSVTQVDVIHYDPEAPVKVAYDTCRQALKAKSKQAACKEVWIFHGTASKNVSKIVEDGFKVGGLDDIPIANGSAYGLGVYTATGPSTPMGYGRDRVILAQGLVGEDRVDSIRPHSDWIIFREGKQLLPAYIVYFQRTPPIPPMQAPFNFRAPARVNPPIPAPIQVQSLPQPLLIQPPLTQPPLTQSPLTQPPLTQPMPSPWWQMRPSPWDRPAPCVPVVAPSPWQQNTTVVTVPSSPASADLFGASARGSTYKNRIDAAMSYFEQRRLEMEAELNEG